MIAAKPRAKVSTAEPPARPRYELRVALAHRGKYQLDLWQLPSPATPRLSAPEHIASLKGRPLELIEHRILKRLARARVDVSSMAPGKEKAFPLDDDLALHLGLLFRTLAPMSKIERIKTVADAIEDMSREEAAYWLGMVIH